MKIYLDDERTTPEGWVRCYWPEEVIALLLLHGSAVECVSLDHDLGGAFGDEYRQDNGYKVLRWIEEAAALHGYTPPKLFVHSANPAARKVMEQAIVSIERFVNSR